LANVSLACAQTTIVLSLAIGVSELGTVNRGFHRTVKGDESIPNRTLAIGQSSDGLTAPALGPQLDYLGRSKEVDLGAEDVLLGWIVIVLSSHLPLHPIHNSRDYWPSNQKAYHTGLIEASDRFLGGRCISIKKNHLVLLASRLGNVHRASRFGRGDLSRLQANKFSGLSETHAVSLA